MGRVKGIFGDELQLPDLKGGHNLAAFGVPRLMGISGPGLVGWGPLPRLGVLTVRLQTFSSVSYTHLTLPTILLV